MKRCTICLLALILLALPTASERSAEPVRLPIVMYHHVSRNPQAWNDYVISEAELESDLQWLRSHGYETISVSELLSWQRGEFEMPEKPCMITFDDGFESTAAYALPLLKQYGCRGVVAVIGSVCQRFTELDEHDPELSNLSWADARALVEDGTIEVQIHTWDMHALSPRNGCSPMKGENPASYRYRLSRDLSRFLSAAAKNGLRLTLTIAYPYGAYDRQTTEAVGDFGLSAAFTCTEKINLLTGETEQLYDLGRFNRPHGISSDDFFLKWEKSA